MCVFNFRQLHRRTLGSPWASGGGHEKLLWGKQGNFQTCGEKRSSVQDNGRIWGANYLFACNNGLTMISTEVTMTVVELTVLHVGYY